MGWLEGHVYDLETQEPLAGVLVIVSDGTDVYSTTTDIDGYYYIADITAGTYTATFSESEYGTFEQTLTIPDEGLIIDMYLSSRSGVYVPWWSWVLLGVGLTAGILVKVAEAAKGGSK